MKRFYIILTSFLLMILGGSVFAQTDNMTLAETTRQITKNCNSDYEKAYAIYNWVTDNITYDEDLAVEMLTNPLEEDVMDIDDNVLLTALDVILNPNKYKWEKFRRMIRKIINNNPQAVRRIQETKAFNDKQLKSGMEVFNNRLGICSSIAHLYQLMCEQAGIPCRIVTGVAKIELDEELSFYGDNFYGGHAWNCIFADGHEILVDATWGLLGEDAFDVDPEEMIFTHLPFKSVDQLISTPVNKEQFVMLPYEMPDRCISMGFQKYVKSLGRIKPDDINNLFVIQIDLMFEMYSKK